MTVSRKKFSIAFLFVMIMISIACSSQEKDQGNIVLLEENEVFQTEEETEEEESDTSETVNDAAVEEQELQEPFTYEVVEDYIVITGYYGTETEVVVPSIIEGKKVKVIGEKAFYWRDAAI